MTNQEKAIAYDNCIHESDRLQRENSKLKSQHTTNVPPEIQKQINENERKIAILVNRLENLFR